MINYRKERRCLVRTALQLWERGLVQGTWGNISLRVSEDLLLITPSGVEYTSLHPGDISLVNMESDKCIKGMKPSSEYKLHKEIYLTAGDLKALIHTHSQALSAVSLIGTPIPPLTEDQAMIIGETIPVSPYALPGTAELACQAAPFFKKSWGCILAHHGYIGGGRSLQEALFNCSVAEKSASIYLSLLSAGKEVKGLSSEDAAFLRESYFHYRPKE